MNSVTSGPYGAASPPAPHDIGTRADIGSLVRSFYQQVLSDPLIGPVFEAAGVDWPEHLEVMTDFWESALLAPGAYRRNALAPHRALHARHPLRPEYFDRWLLLWESTVRRTYSGQVADRAVTKAGFVARALTHNTIGATRPA
ncbi:group III truncated hemoglobin [Streptomyces sp. NPDC086010]|uniref:group III truncated hemoglobin n=1 Tax=Streptomyces sp. NPDC086010 TaxID=3365745 RepID=UPI0037D856E1